MKDYNPGPGTWTDYLNKHAENFSAPLGHDLHLHLVYAKAPRWCVVTRASSVCKVPGRCHRVLVLSSPKIFGIPVTNSSTIPRDRELMVRECTCKAPPVFPCGPTCRFPYADGQTYNARREEALRG